MQKISDKLIKLLKNEKAIFIQTHDFPDPDAIAAAFGLQFLLSQKGITSSIIYEGELQTNPVERMVIDLGISMSNINEVNITDDNKIIIVDGCKGNKNVTNQKGTVIAVIDHHLGEEPEDVSFVDVRNDYGSSSTIIALYLKESKIELIEPIATALAIGIHVDTNSFRRRTHIKDLELFTFLYPKINHQLLGSILRNTLEQKELIIYEKALQAVIIDQGFAFCYYPQVCSQNFLGILADFFLSIAEVEFVALCAHNNDKIIFSIRSEQKRWNATTIIKNVLKNLGSGGGHNEMAGGVIKNIALFNQNQIYRKFKDQLNIK